MRPLILLLATVWSCHGMIIAPSRDFRHNASIVENDIYNLFWTLDDKKATFEVNAKTLGYVGFGISKTGGMKDADIVIGWVKDGRAYFQDRYSARNGEPEIDESQDWVLEEGREEGQYTILRFSRTLTNCDPFDVDITQDTMRIIYAMHDEDPEESTGLTYHGSKNRGTKSLSLVNFVTETEALPADAFYIDLHFDKVEVPAKDTTYYCRGFKVPKLDKKHHVVMVEPLIQPGHEGLVHHFIAYLCPEEINETRHETMNGECQEETMQEIRKCRDIVFAYAIGSGANFIPEIAGYPLGEEGKDTHQFFRLEMHYDNPPPSQAGLVDSSGVRLWLSPTLRKYDAATLSVGINFNPTHVLPPKFKGLRNEAMCSNNCLSKLMGTNEEVQVFSVLLHTHLLGTAITLRHFRDGVELPPILEDQYYDFNFQEFRRLKKLVTVKRGDELTVDCVFNTEKRTGLTFGGESTKEEMCVAFLMYYPKFSTGKTSCYSTILPAHMMTYLDAEIKVTGFGLTDFTVAGSKYEGKDYVEIMEETDWSDKKIQERFQKIMTNRSAPGMVLCPAVPNFFVPLKMMDIKTTYVKEKSCKKKNIDDATGSSINLHQNHGILATITAAFFLTSMF